MIECSTLSYPPIRRIGAELYDHFLLKELQESGEAVRVFACNDNGVDRIYEEIQVNTKLPQDTPDVTICHADNIIHSKLGDRRLKPSVCIVHNNATSTIDSARSWNGELLIANSENTLKLIGKHRAKEAIVLTPRIEVKKGNLKKYERKTFLLVGHGIEKGFMHFINLAMNFPEYDFLCVKGGYGSVMPHPHINNLKVIDHTTELHKIMQKVEATLVLSSTESWSMVAGESIALGTPVIYFENLRGVEENVGEGGVPISDLATFSDIILRRLPTKKQCLDHAKLNKIKHDQQMKITVHKIKELAKN